MEVDIDKNSESGNSHKYVEMFPELTGKLSKFIPGIHYWRKKGLINLDDNDEISKVRLILKVLDQSPGFDFFDEEFNGYSPERVCEILEMVPTIPKEESKISFEYDIITINSFKEAKEVARNESWCIIISEESFNEYTKGGNRFYFLANKNWRKVTCVPGMNFPYDEYGYSLIAVEISPDKEMISVTSRWNNYSINSDSFLSKDELKRMLGEKYKELFK